MLFVYEHTPRIGEFIDPVVEKLSDLNFNKIFLDSPSSDVLINPKVFLDKLRKKNSKNILLENYISIKDSIKINRINNSIKRLWKRLKRQKSFRDIFVYEKVNIWELVEPQLSCYFNLRMKEHIKEIIAIPNVITLGAKKIRIKIKGFRCAAVKSPKILNGRLGSSSHLNSSVLFEISRIAGAIVLCI